MYLQVEKRFKCVSERTSDVCSVAQRLALLPHRKQSALSSDPFCVPFVCFPCACVGFLRVLWNSHPDK